MTIETPDMADVVTQASKGEVAKVNVAVPAYVTAYDATKQEVTVQPVIRWRYTDVNGDGETELPAPIPAVPVLWPQANGLAITFPIVANDWVLLVICDRSIDEWEATGALDNTPQSIRRHSMTDAVAIPGVRPFADPLTNVPTDRVRLGETGANPTRVEITNNHKVRIGDNGIDIVDLLYNILVQLGSSFVLATGAPGTLPLLFGTGVPPDTWAIFEAANSPLLANIKE